MLTFSRFPARSIAFYRDEVIKLVNYYAQSAPGTSGQVHGVGAKMAPVRLHEEGSGVRQGYAQEKH
jgi:hypothetical protein